MITGIHHVTILVRDLDRAVERYEALLGVRCVREDLPSRNVITARFRTGDAWLALVQPTGPGEPWDWLQRRGEGPFLVSLAVPSLDAAMSHVQAAGGAFTTDAPRTGVSGWPIIDFTPESLPGAVIQLCSAAPEVS